MGCARASPSPSQDRELPLVIRHARRLGGELITVVSENGVVTAVLGDDPGSSGLPSEATVVDAAGRWLVPGFIDSHVHTAYFPASAGLPAKGVVAAVDLGMPVRLMAQTIPNLALHVAGPLVTAPNGYPTHTSRHDDFGLAISDPSQAAAIVDDLVAKGAKLVKLALVELNETSARAVVNAAHERKLLVAAHALDDARAALAARIGCDVLAHTPVEPLSAATVEAWSGRIVISTLVAFGASSSAIANLSALRAHDVKVLYGTDLGRTTHVGIDGNEVRAMLAAGMTLPEVIVSATFTPAAIWHFEGYGVIAPAARASFFLTAEDPSVRVEALTAPIRVFVDGKELH
ncbi:MAG: amidohydrolase family protein [Clostridia bacterium]|nr:amidohydrolase family protein [Deltaproteobacteria bacterium]